MKEAEKMNDMDPMDKVGRLPKEFCTAMKDLLGDEYEAFLSSYQEKPKKGLFFNYKKVRQETVEKLVREWGLRPVEWAEGGYHYDEEKVRPGRSPYHDAGIYYIQEPSAMITAGKADIRPGDMVLDLCAAPGGKSCQAAQKAGILISNEIIKKRARVLSSNIERMGYDNVIVCSAAPSELAEHFPESFDRIIVDAPCSGEGMFRKDDTAIAEWSLENVDHCVERQREILDAALRMLKPGGRIVYSTCTFEPYENKWQLRRFCAMHEEELELTEFEQLFPHRIEGEGHFYGVMDSKLTPGDKEDHGPLSASETEKRIEELSSSMKRAGIHVLRAGIEKGELITGSHKGGKRYEHSHAEAMKAGEPVIKPYADIRSEALALKYLAGESLRLSAYHEEAIRLEASEGEELRVLYDGYPLGIARYSGGMLKNRLPKGLRRNPA